MKLICKKSYANFIKNSEYYFEYDNVYPSLLRVFYKNYNKVDYTIFTFDINNNFFIKPIGYHFDFPDFQIEDYFYTTKQEFRKLKLEKLNSL